LLLFGVQFLFLLLPFAHLKWILKICMPQVACEVLRGTFYKFYFFSLT
jgi:hypothetical protein